MSHGTHTHWWMVINNYDATDLALVQQGYPDHIRQLVYTLEKGEQNGTPHIQAYIKMKRDCRMSQLRKLFPNASKFGPCTTAEYTLNAQRYAQKLDGTAQSPATITNWDPLLTLEGVMKHVINKMIDDYGEDDSDLMVARRYVERELVVQDYKYAKVFVSATYKTMWKDFGHQMYECIFTQKQEAQAREAAELRAHTHTHTHTDGKKSGVGGITDADCGEEEEDECEGEGDEDTEGDEDSASETDEGYSEGSSDNSDEEDASSECGE